MAIKIVSFGFKYNSPPGGALCFDCRQLANPHNVPKLRDLTGLDDAVQAYVHADPQAQKLLRRAVIVAKDGDMLAFGCTGGRHRSVALAEKLAQLLASFGYQIEITHSAMKHWR